MSKPRFRRAFILGAYLPHGGTYMAYHLGRILQNDFGVTATAVNVGNELPKDGIFDYDLIMPIVSISEMSQTIADDDILIVNPSFSSYLFGWKIPGFKLSYVQGFSTYSVLDRRFDRYVAVSDFVQRFLCAVYDIDAPVIPAFINLDGIPETPYWMDRPEHCILPYKKDINEEIWDLSYERLRQIVNEAAPHIVFQKPILAEPRKPQKHLLSTIGGFRYLLTLSATEGLHLVGLEAMAMGVVVIGYDGFGGRHYMRPWVNCAVAPYAEIERIAAMLVDVVTSPEQGLAMSQKARETALNYSYSAFRHKWLGEFAQILGVPVPK